MLIRSWGYTIQLSRKYSGVFNTWSACPDDGKRLGAQRKAAESCVSFHEVDPKEGCRGGDWPIDGKRLGACGERLRVAFNSAKRILGGGCRGEVGEKTRSEVGGMPG